MQRPRRGSRQRRRHARSSPGARGECPPVRQKEEDGGWEEPDRGPGEHSSERAPVFHVKRPAVFHVKRSRDPSAQLARDALACRRRAKPAAHPSGAARAASVAHGRAPDLSPSRAQPDVDGPRRQHRGDVHGHLLVHALRNGVDRRRVELRHEGGQHEQQPVDAPDGGELFLELGIGELDGVCISHSLTVCLRPRRAQGAGVA